MDRKVMGICVLSVSAVALMVANFMAPPARAEATANSRDYQAVTAEIQTGGEGLYVVDNRTGLIAIMTYDTNTRTVIPRAARPVTDAFR